MGIVSKIKSFFTTNPTFQYFYNLGGNKVNDEELISGLIFACIDSIASKVAMTNFYLYDTKTNKKIEDDEFIRLIKKPSPYLTGYDFLYFITFHLLYSGRATFEIIKGELTKKPQYLNPVFVSNIEVKDGKVFYIVNKNNEVKTYSEEDILDIRKPHPFNPLKGFSVLEQAKLELEADILSLKTFKKFNEQGAVPSGILYSDTPISNSELEKLKLEMEKRYSGFGNFFKPLVLGGGLKWQSMSFNPEQLKFIESRKFSRDQILAIFKVPKAVLFADDVNRANSEAAKYWFIENTIKPYIDFIVDKLEFDLLRKVYKVNENIVLKYENPIPEDKEYNLKRLETLTNLIITINEARQELGLEPIEGGDKLYLGYDTIGEKKENSKNLSLKEYKKINQTDIEFIKRKKLYTNKLIRKMADKVSLATYLFFKKLGENKKEGFIVENFLVKLKQDLSKLHNDVYQLSVEITDDLVDEISENLSKYKKDFKLVNKESFEQLKKQNLLVGTEMYTTTLYKDVVDIIDEMRKGEFSLKDVIEKIKEEMLADSEWRAERLARSEIINNYNQIENEIIKSVKFDVKKMWLSARDERVCENCRALDGKVIEKNKNFIEGDYEIVHPNCRCTIIPILT